MNAQPVAITCDAVTRAENSCHEALLATLPGATASDRLLVVLLHEFGAGSRLELRQQTWAEGLGWFTQNSLPISREQLAGLRAALGAAQLSGRKSPGRNDSRPPTFTVSHVG